VKERKVRSKTREKTVQKWSETEEANTSDFRYGSSVGDLADRVLVLGQVDGEDAVPVGRGPKESRRVGEKGDTMARDHVFGFGLDRRRWLKLGVGSAVVASLPGTLLDAQSAPQSCAPPIPQDHEPANGGSCPYPIP